MTNIISIRSFRAHLICPIVSWTTSFCCTMYNIDYFVPVMYELSDYMTAIDQAGPDSINLYQVK